ncbi:YbaN family protein [Thiohalomonas denitrificans]|uniref:YbaN family protein n=1 Tax=Thiohalomonas denitrificans TaxID=415747 RepID=UPI0026ED6B3D|nr:YbaN family protein [Thiohalomonas denitrificans]
MKSTRNICWPFALLAYLFTGLALAGIALPGLPTVPFLLVAAWAASRGSKRLRCWLEAHRHLGPLLYCWEQERAIPRRAKQMTVLLLFPSWFWIAWVSSGTAVPVAMAVLFMTVAVYVVTRPNPTQPVRLSAGE